MQTTPRTAQQACSPAGAAIRQRCPEQSHAERLRLLVVAVKLVTGGLELAVGVGLFAFSAAGLNARVAALARQARLQDPNAPLAVFIQHRLPSLASHKVVIAGTLISLGVMKIVGAVGLLKHRAWGFYLLAVLVACRRQLVVREG
jgi:uncharacterized membrane protein